MSISNSAVYSAYLGQNAELLNSILRLYLPEGGKVIDSTWGMGAFWRNINNEKYKLFSSDIENKTGQTCRADFRKLPYKNSEFDLAVFDPPYKLTGTPGIVDRYGNKQGGWKVVDDYYLYGIHESGRVLKHNGILVVKCMDQVVSGKQTWFHRRVFEIAQQMHMLAEDLFVLMRPNATPQPHKRQVHAWKNHSFFWVFRKRLRND